MNVNIFFRKSRPGAKSIEELFATILESSNQSIHYNKIELPHMRADMKSVFGNLMYARKNIRTICHITGDTHYLALATGNKTILTVHDAYSVLKGSMIRTLFLKIFWFWLPALIVRRVTTISDKSRRELESIIPFAKRKIRVIPNPYNPKLLEGNINSDVDHITNTSKPILLHLGTKSNKNLERTIVALDGLPYKLYIIGKLSDQQAELLVRYNIDFRSYFNLPYSEVALLYHQCRAVCFASLYEGFGMPIIEAQLVAKPVITSNIDPMPWVAGEDGAHLVDPFEVSQIREGIIRVMEDEEYRSELIVNGLNNVRRFEPGKIARMYEEVYRELKGASK